MPTKKPRGEELTQEQQLANQALNQRRLRIEHVNSSVKRCRIVKDRIRLWKEGVRDLVMELCCALHNFRVRLTPGNQWFNRDKLNYFKWPKVADAVIVSLEPESRERGETRTRTRQTPGGTEELEYVVSLKSDGDGPVVARRLGGVSHVLIPRSSCIARRKTW